METFGYEINAVDVDILPVPGRASVILGRAIRPSTRATPRDRPYYVTVAWFRDFWVGRGEGFEGLEHK